jgi:hypothetical protein
MLFWSMGMAPGLVLAGVGDLDPAYGDGGRVVITGPVGTLGDGSLIYTIPSNVAGSTDYAHVDINGHADTLFGGSGRLTLPVDGLAVDGPQAPPLRTPAGQLLFAVRQGGQVSLLGLDATGHPDPSFGTAGIVNLAPISSNCPNDRIEGLAFQPDGHLLTLVSDYGNGYYDQVLLSVAIRRFNASGSLDPTFGNGSGVVASTFASCNSGGFEGTATLNVLQGGAMDIFLPTMRSYFSAAGASLAGPPVSPGLRTDIAEWRYGGTLPNGDQLLTNGATPPNSSSPSSGGSPDGAPSEIVIARVHPDGTLVNSFGGAGTGYAQLDIGALVSSETGIAESLQTIRITSDGQHIYMAILLLRQCGASYCSNGDTLGLVLARLLAQGSQAGTLDRSFGNDGIVLIGKAAVLNITDIVEQPGGGVVLTTGGSAIRLLGDGTPSQGVLGAAGDYFWVPVSDDTAQVRVARTLGKDGAVSVNYATSAAPNSGEPAAVAGTDYTAVSGRLDWADGDSADKIIQIPVIHNSGTSASRILTVRLTAPTGDPWIIWGNPTVYIDSSPPSTPSSTQTASTTSSATVGATSSAIGGGGSFGPWSIGLLSLCCLMTLTRRREELASDVRQGGFGSFVR